MAAVTRALHVLCAGIGSVLALAVTPGAGGVEKSVRGDLAGKVRTYIARDETTLLDVARREEFGNVELRAANPDVDPWLPGEGTPVVLPTAFVRPAGVRRGIVINLSEQRLYYFRGSQKGIITNPIGVPADAELLPIGSTEVIGKRPDPTWFPPRSLKEENPDLATFVPPGPGNPLGAFAISFAWPNFVIHGTTLVGVGIGS